MISLQNVSKYYYSDSGVTPALRKINLEFDDCGFVAITGESGSGKSTLLNIISGMDTFDDGEMYFQGEPTFQYDEQDWEQYRRDRIGFVFQDYNLIGHYTVLDNIIGALLIQGTEPTEAGMRSLDYLEQVGLKEYADQRASQLSSGQKQRLSIARALAKETDVIVADEPTGNLDSETGVQIVRLLQQIAKKKLVIMVTHNYEQAEPFISRKIRLHDGEVVSDTEIRDVKQEHSESNDSDEVSFPKYHKGNKLLFFVRKNIITQRGRSALYFSFLFLTAIVSFVFLGMLYQNRDDRATREYDNSAYYHEDNTRLGVRHLDKKDMTEEDLAEIEKLKYVEQADLCDFANDIKYYITEGSDYETIEIYASDTEIIEEGVQGSGSSVEMVIEGEEDIHYEADSDIDIEMDVDTDIDTDGQIVIDTADSDDEEKGINRGVRLLKSDKFMMSATAIDEKDLRTGRLPEGRNEIVLYAPDDSVLEEDEKIYFTAPNIWGNGQYYGHDFTVVGLLKEKTEQVYFSLAFCQMLTSSMTADNSYTLQFCQDSLSDKYYGELTLLPVIGDGLEGNQVRVSMNQSVPNVYVPSYMTAPDSLEEMFRAGSEAVVVSVSQQEGTEQEYTVEFYDPAAQDGNEAETEHLFHDNGSLFLEVSEEMFQKWCPAGTPQMSVYITDYAKTDKVLKELNKLGYDAISTFRVSATDYIWEKVEQRLITIGISLAVLAGLVVFQVLLGHSLMKLKQRDYRVLRSMGLSKKGLGQLGYLEMSCYAVAAWLLTAVVMSAAGWAGVVFLKNMLLYYDFIGVLIFLLYNAVNLFLMVFFFNRSMRKKVTV